MPPIWRLAKARIRYADSSWLNSKQGRIVNHG